MKIPNDGIENARVLERAWIRDRAISGEVLDDHVRSMYGYALRLAGMRHAVARSGIFVNIDGTLQDFRAWLLEQMASLSEGGWQYDNRAESGVGTLCWRGKWRRVPLIEFYPTLARALHGAIVLLRARHPELDDYSLQDNLIEKGLVLSLGGGGATGFAHACLFQWLEELEISPVLITGTSFGALLGYLRAMQTRYDAAVSMLHMPGLMRILHHLRPCFAQRRFGLAGIFDLNFSSLCQDIAHAFGYSQAPTFDELKMPFACVASGIAFRNDVACQIDPEDAGFFSGLWRLTHATWRKAMSRAAKISNFIAAERTTVPIIFGLDADTRQMPVIDAAAFSALVPGVLTYEVSASHRRSIEVLERLFKTHDLYRLCDGGLVSNVPVRAARAILDRNWGGFARGVTCRHDNVWLVGVDVFAPQPKDGVLFPLQQIANRNAVIDAAEADSFIRLRYLLNPLEFSPALSRMHWLNIKFRKAFDVEMAIIRYATKRLLPMAALDLAGF